MVQNAVTGREEGIITEVTTGPKPGSGARRAQAVYDYVFSRDGGAIDTFLMRGPVLPDNAILVGAYIDVVVVPTSGGSATIGLGVASTTDINAEDAISGAPWSSTGTVDADAGPDPGDESTFIKLTATGGMQITIGTAALTAGQFFVVVDYDVTE